MKTSFEQYVATHLAKDLAAQQKASILLLTCMDYRYAHRIVDVMDRANLRGKYDMFVLAGAAAGANENQTWRLTLVEHIRTAREIDHPIDRLIILEHRDCGAYRAFFGLDWSMVTPPVEEERHAREVIKLIKDLKIEFRNDPLSLTIEAILLTRDEDDALTVEITHP